MTVTSVRLVNGSSSMDLLPNDNITITNLDKGYPEIREVVSPNPDYPGTHDLTRLYGSAAVTLDLEVYNTPSELIRQLSQYLLPRSRPYLVVTDTEWSSTRRISLRPSQFGGPVTGGVDHIYRQAQVSWIAPKGVWESDTLTTVSISADTGTSAGLTFSVIFPVTWPAGTQAGLAELASDSTLDVFPVLRMYGPCTGPQVTLENTSETLKFLSSLVLSAGEYVEVDTEARTALLNGTVSRLSDLDYSVSEWITLRAGETNRVRYHPASGVGTGSHLEILYRNAWLL